MYSMRDKQAEGGFDDLVGVHLDHPLATTRQHVAWENGSLRVECNQVRNVNTLEDRLAVRIVPAVEAYYSAVVVPLESHGRLHLIGRYRYPISRWSLEFPRFDLESGDGGWKVRAEADLFRITGLHAERMSLLGAVEIDPALLSTSAVVILAEGCQPAVSQKKTKTAGGRRPAKESPPAADELDDLVAGTVALSLLELAEWVRHGQVTCGVTLAAFSLYRATVR